MLITDQWTRTVLRVLGASIVAIVALAMLLTRTAYANDIAHFDVYTDRDTIHLLTGHGKKGDPSIALFHRRSVDGGATWSAPVRVNRDDDTLHSEILRGFLNQLRRFKGGGVDENLVRAGG